MNGIEKITSRIEAEAQADIDRVLTEAKAQASDITKKFQAQASAERAEQSARNEKAAAEREDRLVSVAQMEARKVTLAAKQEMVDKAYALALEKLQKLPEKQAVQVLSGLLVQAAPNGRGSVVFSADDRERVGAAAVKKANETLNGGALTLAEETRPICGGFILVNGSVEVNCTFDTLVRLQRTETAGAVAKQLFPAE